MTLQTLRCGLTTKAYTKRVTLRHALGPLGVRGRNSDNRLVRDVLGWEPKQPLDVGLEKTYRWVAEQVKRAKL